MRTTADLVGRFSVSMAGRLLHEHGVASGLGVWLLLALVAPTIPPANRGPLEDLLGTDVADAAARAQELLAHPHQEVAAAVAVWADFARLNSGFAQWSQTLLPPVSQGPVPTKAAADAWVAEHSKGLIKSFPLPVGEQTLLVLTSVLATKVGWAHPFDLTAEPLAGTFGDAKVLVTPKTGHDVFIADTTAAGQVAVHTAASNGGLRVISVIADPAHRPAAVHAAAWEVAALTQPKRSTGAPIGTVRRVDPFTMELGDGHSWSLTESTQTVSGTSPTAVWAKALLPTWAAQSSHDLAGEPWFASVNENVQNWASSGLGETKVQQTAVAAYDREGFAAAAVTTMQWLRSMPPMSRTTTVRHLTARFNRPYAALAVVFKGEDETWQDVPVFSAWVGRGTS